MAEENLLIVEGPEEQNVVRHLFIGHRIEEGLIGVKSSGGVEALKKSLSLELRSDQTRRLGIIVDADTDLDRRWRSLRNILIANGYTTTPDRPSPEGTIMELDDTDAVRVPRVGVWIMPDNQTPGILENFVGLLGATTDPLWAIAEDCLNHLPDVRFRENHRPKAHLLTWLAWQEEPGKPMGLAITKRFLDPNAELAERLISWIRRLFDVRL